ncbi:type VI secretion system Vgr family protein, partial [Roseateles sp.]|uniref:type VI secretion system Vgr family protein n=1 Tax=Roseateles sp. TaxID=1971397 RepID=UPI003BA892F2
MSALLGGSAHVMSITVGGDDDKFKVLRVDGSERLNRLPQYTVDVVGNHSLLTGRERVDIHGLLGKKAHITFDVHGSKRHIDGYVIKVQRGERHGRYDRYDLVVQPWLWFASRSRNSRVFQNKTVKEIVSEVLTDYSSDYDWKLEKAADLPTLEYCLQYEESDLDFVSRLLEEYGVYYFFEHSATAHTLVMVDAISQHSSRDSAEPVAWSNKFDGDHCMTEWHTVEEARSVKAVVRDYDYLASATEIEATHAGPSAGAKLGEAEIYQFPAKAVLNQTVATSKSASTAAAAVAKRLVEAAQSMQKLHTGTTNAYDMVCGTTFKLSDAPLASENTEYLIVGCDFRAEYGDHEAISDIKSIKRRRDGFEGHVIALNTTSGVFRPDRSTPRPRMYGPQIATVVGASGNEIETDVNGRIKIQFPWDRKGEKNENSSCWVRVAQPWAGKKMGLWMLPRVGHEVVVSFIGGDPDRPLVTGSVHNDANPPPHELPAHADVATWISHSTKDGAEDANHELRFCDTKGSEHVWFQSQKDFYRHVKGDTFDHLAMNESRKVVKTVKEAVGENWYLNVGKDVKHDLGKDFHTTVAGDVFTTGGASWQIELATDYSLKVGADLSIDVTGKTALKSAGDVNVQTDGAINLKSTGNLVGQATGKVSLKSAADVLMEGINVKAKGSAEIVLEATAGIKIVCGASVITL